MSSMSVTCRVRLNGVGVPLFDMLTLAAVPSVITGGSLTGVIVIETVAILLSPVPSLTLKVKLSGPFRFRPGV